jgi:hypothetical protein
MKDKAFLKTLLIRGAIVVFWIALGTVLFISSRGHTLLIDNKDQESLALEASDLITVYVDGGWGVEYFRDDRDRITVAGTKHRIRIEFSDGTPPFDGKFSLPIKDDMYLLSVPKMVNGIEPFVEVFHVAPDPREAEEEDVPAPDEVEVLAP